MPKTSSRTNNKWTYAATSGIQGRGLFARMDIPEGVDLVEYEGPRISTQAGKRLADQGNVFVFEANGREFIDGSVSWNLGRFANHSCSPNAQSVRVHGHIWLRALHSIRKGEEITYDYGYHFRDTPTSCQCGSTSCVGVIVAARHRQKL